MPDCELLKGCLFFNDKMPDNSGMGVIYKGKYCQGTFTNCARFRVAQALGRPHVPTDLYPNMLDRAQELIRSKK